MKNYLRSINYPALFHIAAILAVYIVSLFSFSFLSYVPPHDNRGYHFWNYLYFSKIFASYLTLPSWYPFDGGVPVGITSPQLFSLLPHRLLGYILYKLAPLDPVASYNITLVLGMIITIVGWWLFLFLYTKSRISASIGSLMILLGGSGITIFHQEQIIATTVCIPWILITLMTWKGNKSLFIFSTLLGLSLTFHYPHIQLIVWSFIAPFYLLKKRVRIKPVYLIGFLLFLLSASPLFYIYRNIGDFYSPRRDMKIGSGDTFDEFVDLNLQQLSSAPFSYIAKYIAPKAKYDDQYAYYVTVTGILLALAGVIFNWRKSLPFFFIMLISLWASFGMNGYLPHLLFLVKFPFINSFRQWYHFVPIINLSLSVLGCLGYSAIISFFKNSGTRLRAPIVLISLLVPLSMVLESKSYFNHYFYIDYLFPEKFSSLLKSDSTGSQYDLSLSFGKDIADIPLVVYDKWHSFITQSPDKIKNKFFLLKSISSKGIGELSQRNLTNDNIHFLNDNDYVILPNGIEIHLETNSNGFLIMPFAYGLGLKAKLNEHSASTYSVFDGALTGLFIPSGRSSVTTKIGFSLWKFIILPQIIFLPAIMIWLFCKSIKKEEGSNNQNIAQAQA